MRKTPLLLLASVFTVLPLAATTHVVLPSTSIQEKVDIASAGDTIVIFGGTYQQNVTVDEAVTIVPVEGDTVNITGDLSLSADGIVVRDINTIGTGISTGPNCVATVIGGQHSDIHQTTGELTVHSSEILDEFTTTSGAEKTVCFRTTVTNRVDWDSSKGWFGYSESKYFSYGGNGGKLVVVASSISSNGSSALQVSGSSNLILIANSIVEHYQSGTSVQLAPVKINGNQTGYILNNFVKNKSSNRYGSGIYIGVGTDFFIMNNQIINVRYGINAPFGVSASNNLYWNFREGERDYGDVIVQNTIYADPLFIDGDPRTLQPGSPCLNAGIDNPLYANRDGTRNTIGPTGGAWYDPEGWTTENPVVISFDLGPEVLLEGVDTGVLLSNGQAVSQP